MQLGKVASCQGDFASPKPMEQRETSVLSVAISSTGVNDPKTRVCFFGARNTRGGTGNTNDIVNGMTGPKNNKKRSAPISYRPPEGLRGELYARHLKSGLSMNAFITEAIFGRPMPRQTRRAPVEEVELVKLLALAASIRDELASLQNTPQDHLEAERLLGALDDLSVLRSAIFSALGRST